MQISQRAAALAESATMAVSSRAAQMKRDGIDVVTFGAGEPDFDTPAPIRDAVKRHIDAGRTRYAPNYGIPEARKAVQEKLRRDNGLTYDVSQIMMTCGGKEALWLAFSAILNPGDEVLLPVPYWVSFPEQIRLCGGVVRPLMGREADSFKLAPSVVRSAITPNTKAIVFNSPSNPGGFTYTPDETRAIAAALRGTNVTVIADELYDRLRFDGVGFISFASIDDDAYQRTVTINSPAKSYAMTGWRVGFAAGPKPIIDAMSRLQSHMTSGPCTFNQFAAADALTGDQASVEAMRREFEKRGRHMHARLTSLAGVTCVPPTGAFYCFPNVRGTYAKLGVSGSVEFARQVLEKAHVALVPGEPFGSDDHVRLSYATSLTEIDRGLDRLAKLL